MLTLSTLLLTAILATIQAACGTATGGLDDATQSWRRGVRSAASNWAHTEVARFQRANNLDDAALDATVRAIDARFDAGLPIIAEGDHAADSPLANNDGDVLRTLHRDLLTTGTTRVLRAIRAARALVLPAFGPELLAIVASHNPYTIDGPLLSDLDTAKRSVGVKAYALRALDALTGVR